MRFGIQPPVTFNGTGFQNNRLPVDNNFNFTSGCQFELSPHLFGQDELPFATDRSQQQSKSKNRASPGRIKGTVYLSP
jgi:hypothetical protein